MINLQPHSQSDVLLADMLTETLVKTFNPLDAFLKVSSHAEVNI